MFDEHKPLFIYLQTASVALLGQPVLGLRLVAALFGIAAVAATFVLAYNRFNRWVAFLACAGLASSFGMSPMAGSPCGPTLCRYWRCSAFISSRALPLVFVLFIAWLVVVRDLSWRRGLVIMLTIGVVSALVFAPLGLHFLNQPSIFFTRIEHASILGSEADPFAVFTKLLSSIADNFGMFMFRGDAMWRQNYSLRPVFDPISSVFFLCVLMYTLYRIRRREFSFLVIWLLVMFLPGILSSESPYYLRLLPLAPVTYIVFAVSLVEVGAYFLHQVERLRLKPRLIKQVYVLAVVGLMYSAAIITFHDYFQVRAFDPMVFAAFDGGISASAEFLNTVEGEPVVLAVTTRMIPYYSVAYLSRHFDDRRWYDDRQSLTIPFDNRPRPDLIGTPANMASPEKNALFILIDPHSPWLAMLEKGFPQGKVAAIGRRPDGGVSFTAYSVLDVTNLAVPLRPRFPFKVGLGNDVQTLGYDLEGAALGNAHPTLQAGETLTVTLYWRPLRGVNPEDYRIFVHLVDANLKGGWGHFDNNGYSSSQWHGDELVFSLFGIRVPDNAPSGKYNLMLGIYNYPDVARLGVLSESGQEIGDIAGLPPLKIKGRDVVSPTPKNQVMASFGDRARLIGYDLPENAAGGLPVRLSPKVNSNLGVTLYWEGSKSMKEDYTVFVQLLDSSGKLASQVDGQPAGGAFPTSFWDDGDLVTDFHELPLPNTLAAGQCKRVAGLYILRTGERLRTEAGADSIELGTITVE